MAENIMGGGYIAPAKPFNVLNPSGVSSESALDTLLAVGEGKRQRAFQARQSSAAMEFQQREGERERMFQSQQTAGAQQFAEQQRRKGVESEEYFRTREENFTLLVKDAEDAKTSLDFEIDMAVRQGQWERAAKLKAEQGTLDGQVKEGSNRLTKLQMLKAAYDGVFSTNSTTNEGKSIGAETLRGLSNIAVSKAQHFKGMQERLRGATSRLIAGKGMEAARKSQELMNSKGDFQHPAPDWDPKTQGRVVHTPGKAAPDITEGPQKPEWRDLPVEEKVKEAGGRWKDLSEAITEVSVGEKTQDVAQTRVGVEVLLNTLEQAVAVPGQSDYYMKEAAQQYQKLIASGLDQDHLDKALYALHMEAATAGGAKGSLEGQGVVSTEGKEGAAPVINAAQDMVLLSEMLDRFKRQTVPDENGKPTRLLKGFGESEFFDFKNGQGVDHFGPLITQVFQTLSNSSDPEDLLRRLTNTDKTDDPDSLQFIHTLHPEVREVLVKELSKASQDIQSLRTREDIGQEVGAITDIPGLKEEQDRLLQRRNVDLPNEITQAGLEDTTAIRKQYTEGKKKLGEKREEGSKRIREDMDNARERALNGRSGR